MVMGHVLLWALGCASCPYDYMHTASEALPQAVSDDFESSSGWVWYIHACPKDHVLTGWAYWPGTVVTLDKHVCAELYGGYIDYTECRTIKVDSDKPYHSVCQGDTSDVAIDVEMMVQQGDAPIYYLTCCPGPWSYAGTYGKAPYHPPSGTAGMVVGNGVMYEINFVGNEVYWAQYCRGSPNDGPRPALPPACAASELAGTEAVTPLSLSTAFPYTPGRFLSGFTAHNNDKTYELWSFHTTTLASSTQLVFTRNETFTLHEPTAGSLGPGCNGGLITAMSVVAGSGEARNWTIMCSYGNFRTTTVGSNDLYISNYAAVSSSGSREYNGSSENIALTGFVIDTTLQGVRAATTYRFIKSFICAP